MNQKAKPITKYRPVLTATQILHILTLAKSEYPLTQDSMNLIVSLSPFAAKIDNAGIQAAYVTTPRKDTSSLEALGAAPSIPATQVLGVNKEEYWEQCYQLYISNPTACSLAQINAAKEHMYLNELLSPEEVAEFESNL